MPYDCTTLPQESKSVGRCPSGGSGTLESVVCMCMVLALVHGGGSQVCL